MKVAEYIMFILAFGKSQCQEILSESFESYKGQFSQYAKLSRYIKDVYGNKLNTASLGQNDARPKYGTTYPYAKLINSTLFGIDVEHRMVVFTGSSNTPFKLILLDLMDTKSVEKMEKIDILFSDFTLQWMRDQSLAMKNLFSLLKPGGQASLKIEAKSGISFVWDEVAKLEKWRTHLKDFKEKLNIYSYMDNPLVEFRKFLLDAGFTIHFSDLYEKKNIFENEKITDVEIAKQIRMLDPYLDSIPDALKDEYEKDVFNLTMSKVASNASNGFVALVALLSKPMNYTLLLGNPELYTKHVKDQQIEAEHILNKYKHLLKWESNERVLDIGSRSGNITYHVIYPLVESTNSSMIGVDTSWQMVKYANKMFENVSSLRFELFHLTRTNQRIISFGKFDKIFSFFTLQWIDNQSLVAKNIYSLLKPGGQAFLYVLAKSGIFIAWDEVAKYEKWRPYLKGAPEKLNVYAYMDDPLAEFKKVFSDVGFKIDFSELQERKNVFKTENITNDEMIERIRTIDPHVSKIPKELVDEYLSDVLNLTKQKMSLRGGNNYSAIVAVLSKSNIYKFVLENPVLYSTHVKDQQIEAKYILEKYGHYIKWGTNESIINIDTRTGNVTSAVLYPIVKSKNSKLVGTDVSWRMVDYANRMFRNGTSLSFEVLDLSDADSVKKFENFDKIFSFFTFQWAVDKSLVARNMLSLLKPGGQAALFVFAKSEIFFAWDNVAKNDKWRNYLKGVPEKINIYAYMDNPLVEFNKTLVDAGFTIDFSEVITKTSAFHSQNHTYEEQFDWINAVDPYVSMIPISLQSDYIYDVMEVLEDKKTEDYTAMVAFVSKPLN